MQDQFSKPEVEAKISEFIKNIKGDDAPLATFKLQNLKDIHLNASIGFLRAAL